MINHISKFRTEKDQTDMDAAYGAEQVTEEKDVPGGTPHLNKNKIESNLSVPGIGGHQKKALIKSFEMSPHLTCL